MLGLVQGKSNAWEVCSVVPHRGELVGARVEVTLGKGESHGSLEDVQVRVNKCLRLLGLDHQNIRLTCNEDLKDTSYLDLPVLVSVLSKLGLLSRELDDHSMLVGALDEHGYTIHLPAELAEAAAAKSPAPPILARTAETSNLRAQWVSDLDDLMAAVSCPLRVPSKYAYDMVNFMGGERMRRATLASVVMRRGLVISGQDGSSFKYQLANCIPSLHGYKEGRAAKTWSSSPRTLEYLVPGCDARRVAQAMDFCAGGVLACENIDQWAPSSLSALADRVKKLSGTSSAPAQLVALVSREITADRWDKALGPCAPLFEMKVCADPEEGNALLYASAPRRTSRQEASAAELTRARVSRTANQLGLLASAAAALASFDDAELSGEYLREAGTMMTP